jgi:hypothetical protein
VFFVFPSSPPLNFVLVSIALRLLISLPFDGLCNFFPDNIGVDNFALRFFALLAASDIIYYKYKKNYKYGNASLSSTISTGNKYKTAFIFINDSKTVIIHITIINQLGYFIKCLDIRIKIKTKIATRPNGHILKLASSLSEW